MYFVSKPVRNLPSPDDGWTPPEERVVLMRWDRISQLSPTASATSATTYWTTSTSVLCIRNFLPWRIRIISGMMRILVVFFNLFLLIVQLTHFRPLFNCFQQCSGSMTFWCGSGSEDPCLWLVDPDQNQDPGSESCYFRHWPSRCQQKTSGSTPKCRGSATLVAVPLALSLKMVLERSAWSAPVPSACQLPPSP